MQEYSVEYKPDEGIVEVKISERINFQTVEKYSTQAVKTARANSCTKFLLDHSDTEIDNEVFRLHVDGEELEQFGFKSNDFIAVIVVRPTKKTIIPDVKSGHNKWPTVKIFEKTDLQKALNWLKTV